MTPFASRVIDVVRALPRGDVVTYGEVAALAGKPGAARGVGAVLAASGGLDLPWWRVVNAAGRVAPGNASEHARRLRAEGVAVRDDRVMGFGSRRAAARKRGGGRRADR